MPLIKDKDRYKKLSIRDRGRARITEDANLPNKLINTTLRAKQESIDTKRSEDNLASISLNNIQSVSPAVDTVINIFTLSPGQTLKRFLISNNDTSGHFDLHWSSSTLDELTLTTSSGLMNDSNRLSTRLYRRIIGAYSSFAGANDANEAWKTVSPYELGDMFNKVEKTTYFYFISDVDVDITYLIS